MLLLIVLAAYLFLSQPKKFDVWNDTTVPYDPACAENCEMAGSLGSSHGSPPLDLVFNPKVDDPVAQWGDCVQSVFVCLQAGTSPDMDDVSKAQNARTCVAQSICPQLCRDAYAKQAAASPGAAQQAFEDIFISETASCRPAPRPQP